MSFNFSLIENRPIRDQQIWIRNVSKRKGFSTALGKQIYWQRRRHGLSLNEALIKFHIEPETHAVYMKRKKYKRYIETAHVAAKAWWLSKIGDMALSNRGNLDLLKIHFRNEFGVELDEEPTYIDKGFVVTVRSKAK